MTAIKKWAALSLSLLALAAHADGVRMPAAPAIYKTECAACHTAYPPGLLSEKDWRKTMTGLASHFGTDASLAPHEVKEISNFLFTNAATNLGRYGAPADPPRLTQTAWFEREHLRKLPASVWLDSRVKSASNCAACHTRADQGSFSENDIAVPGFPGRRW